MPAPIITAIMSFIILMAIGRKPRRLKLSIGLLRFWWWISAAAIGLFALVILDAFLHEGFAKDLWKYLGDTAVGLVMLYMVSDRIKFLRQTTL